MTEKSSFDNLGNARRKLGEVAGEFADHFRSEGGPEATQKGETKRAFEQIIDARNREELKQAGSNLAGAAGRSLGELRDRVRYAADKTKDSDAAAQAKDAVSEAAGAAGEQAREAARLLKDRLGKIVPSQKSDKTASNPTEAPIIEGEVVSEETED